MRQTAKPLEIKIKMREVGCNSDIMCQKVAPLQQQKKHNRIQATVFGRQPSQIWGKILGCILGGQQVAPGIMKV